jgi:hypothetical protein
MSGISQVSGSGFNALPRKAVEATDNKQPKRNRVISHYESDRKIELDTPNHEHLTLQNSGTSISEMLVSQGRNIGDEATLCLTDKADEAIHYAFTKPAGEDTFTYGGTSCSLNKMGSWPTDFCRTKQGELAVRGIAEAKESWGEGETFNLGYTEKAGVPIVTIDLARVSEPHIQFLLKKGVISPQLQFEGKRTKDGSVGNLSVAKNWQIVQPKAGFKDVSMAEDVADKIKPSVADWYQQVHPDLLIQKAKKLPTPDSLEALGITQEIETTNDY